MADNDIGVEGAKALSEMLAVNTTMKHLSLWGGGEKRRKRREPKKKRVEWQTMISEVKEQRH